VVATVGSDDDSAPSADRTPRRIEPSRDGLVGFSDPSGEFEIAIPTSWAGAVTRGDTAGIGTEVFPDDAQRAEAFEQIAATMPRVIVFLAVNDDQLVGAESPINMSVAVGPGEADLDELEDAAESSVRAFGASPSKIEVVELGAGTGVRIEYDLPRFGTSGTQYYVAGGGQIWTLTFTASQGEDHALLFDQVAGTFDVTR
jgi:hypothetical protein